MPGIAIADIPQVVQSYLESYDNQTYVDVARNRQHSIFAADFVSNGAIKKAPKAGTYRIQFLSNRVRNTERTSINSTDSVNRGNTGSYGSVSMAFQKTHMAVNKMEPAFGSGGETEIVNYLDQEMQNMYDDFFETNDDWLFTLPTYPNTVDPLFWSIPSWVVPYTTSSDFGFNGANPGSYASIGGIDRSQTANAGHRNGTFEYTTIDQMDFCKVAAEAVQKCGFRPYYAAPKTRAKEETSSQRFKMYSDFATWQSYQDIAYTSNDNIGQDQAVYRRGTRAADNVFMTHPWTWVPARLDDGDETEVIGTGYFYGLDLSTWEFNHYGEWFMKKGEPVQMENQHNTLVTWMDTGFQLWCRNPRCNFVGVPAA